MNSFFLHFLSLPAVARLNRRLAGLALLWLLLLLLLNPAANASSANSEQAAVPRPGSTTAVATLLR